jgi:branched-chain amino acid aminotransferase
MVGTATQFPYVFVDGEFVTLDDARVGVHTNALSYGTGTFEGIRAFWAPPSGLNILAASEHYERLHRSARILGMTLPYSVRELVDASVELLQINDVREDAYLRPLFVLGSQTLQVRVHDLVPRLSIAVTPMGLNYINPNGVRCAVSTWRRAPDLALPSRAKITGGYMGPALAKTEALCCGADEAIMLNMKGHVAEASTSNIFLRVGNTWTTPPPEDDILEGITRRELMVLIEETLHERVRERSVDRSELYTADEILLCGTAALVVPVISIDRRPVGDGVPGERTLMLQRSLLDIARGNDGSHPEWRTFAPLASPASERA